jgi:FkbM family methyltransferase
MTDNLLCQQIISPPWDKRSLLSDFISVHSYLSTKKLLINYISNQDATIIDIGANIGYTSLAYSKILPDAKIICYEPNPISYHYLLLNTRNNDNIVCFNKALGNKTGKTILSIPSYRGYPRSSKLSLGHSSIINHNYNVSNKQKPSGGPSAGWGGEERSVQTNQMSASIQEINKYFTNYSLDKNELNTWQVEVDTLDNVLSSTENVGFVKIDVEGAEYKVLDGMKNIIKNEKPVIEIELNRWTLNYDSNDRLSIFKLLNEFGYTGHFNKQKYSRNLCLRDHFVDILSKISYKYFNKQIFKSVKNVIFIERHEEFI